MTPRVVAIISSLLEEVVDPDMINISRGIQTDTVSQGVDECGPIAGKWGDCRWTIWSALT